MVRKKRQYGRGSKRGRKGKQNYATRTKKKEGQREGGLMGCDGKETKEVSWEIKENNER